MKVKIYNSISSKYQALKNPKTAPVIIWMNGGPGLSSLYGFFLENGPLELDSTGTTLSNRTSSWNQIGHVIYFDNPIGAGFSYTQDARGYSVNEIGASKNLYEALRQFYQLFPNLQTNDLYLTGESYACKFIASLGALIISKNRNPRNIEFHLKGEK